MRILKQILLFFLGLSISNDDLKEFIKWKDLHNYSEPFPTFVKKQVFHEYNSSSTIWVETGTLVGDTAKYLSKIAKFVYTIEPSEKYYNLSVKNLTNYENVKIYNDNSENKLNDILEIIKPNSDVCFWLDGHWSGGDTFKGETDTPILSELETIKRYLNKFSKLNILIDDFRIFDIGNNVDIYPSKEVLIEYAAKNNLKWRITRDIFILSKEGIIENKI
tara:strand:+ start:55 stop:711 length:657 start_codon:yes stop_codon:yes gene_type:complete